MGTPQRADPGARRKAIRVLIVVTLFGLCALLALEKFEDRFGSWLESNIEFLLENPILVFAGAMVLVSPVLATGTYLMVLARRTVQAQRFPPPGYAVARDTPVAEDGQAIRRGRIIQLLALFLLCCAAAIAAALWYMFRSLGASG